MSDTLSKISYASSIVDMSDERTDQSMRTTLKGNFADSGNVCFGVVILSLVLALVLAQERQDNRSQHLINVQFADQVSLCNHQICRLSFNISRRIWRMLVHENPCLIRILEFCKKWREDQSTLTLEFRATIGATNSNKVPI